MEEGGEGRGRVTSRLKDTNLLEAHMRRRDVLRFEGCRGLCAREDLAQRVGWERRRGGATLPRDLIAYRRALARGIAEMALIKVVAISGWLPH